ncbi:MAG: type II/IV secretion system protein [Candidatus Eremiobacteraeota bacterium]|nr:type II/IV secretion system protein [Candidatus Eremiobacteraeota bacterium]
MIFNVKSKNTYLPILNFLMQQGFIPRQDIKRINHVIATEEVEVEDLLFEYISRDKLLLAKALFHNDKFGSIDLLEVEDQIDYESLGLISREEMLDSRSMIIYKTDGYLAVAMDDPTNKEIVKYIEKTTETRIRERFVTLFSDIREIISQDRLMSRYMFDQGILPPEDYKKIKSLFGSKITELEEVLLRYVSREVLLQIKAVINSGRYDNIDLFEIRDGLKEESVGLLSKEQMLEHRVMVLYENEGELAIAMDDPSDNSIVRFVERTTGCKVKNRYVTLYNDIGIIIQYMSDRIRKKEEASRKEQKAGESQEELSPESVEEEAGTVFEEPPQYDVLDLSTFTLGGDASAGGVRPLIETIIKQALVRSASDIHIEPTRDKFMKVRYRIDGILTQDYVIDDLLAGIKERDIHDKVVSIVKVLSGESGKNMRLDVSNKPQDGRIYIRSVNLDLRIAILPSVLGESVVIRVLQRESRDLSLDKLGFEKKTYQRFKSIIEMPYGMILISGPTGSGKSTTQYAAIKLLNSPGKKILTAEDPVEYSISGATQVQINPAADFTFDIALRAFVRNDPDIIMVGEIRDVVTASMAMESALTGHMVLTSIHANDAVSTLFRLKDMGVDPRLITATCIGTMGQRLVRRNCSHCGVPFAFSSKLHEEMEQHGVPFDPKNLLKGTGCPKCYYTGYHGRIGVFELLAMTYDVRELFLQEASADRILEKAREDQNMRTLLEDALAKVAEGITTEEEVWRVILLERAKKIVREQEIGSTN